MLILKNVMLPLGTDFSALDSVLSGMLKTKVCNAVLYRRSVDARRKPDIKYCCSVLVSGNEKQILKNGKKYSPAVFSPVRYALKRADRLPKERPVIVGFGPAGMFAALVLASAGLSPIVLEQGRDADSRIANIEKFRSGGALDTLSNIQFGEGGAGTFSDGKLNTGINDERIRFVLETFVRFGADPDILFEAKPHIGTDVLVNVVKNMRREIIGLGGEVRFCSRVTDITGCDGGVRLTVEDYQNKNEYSLECSELILAIGHSARATYKMLLKNGVNMEQKPFSVGARIEHRQKSIDLAKYGTKTRPHELPPADYKLSVHLENGRGVYTFCMCPGGYVVNGASEEGGVVTNGMSYRARGGENANSALLVGVGTEDFGSDDPLAGVRFQEKIERAAFNISGSYSAVCQTVGDFLKNEPSDDYSDVEPTVLPKPVYGNIGDVLPPFVCGAMREGIVRLDKKLKGFADGGAVLTAPETRSSSPVRILRDKNFESNLRGLFPCGEGAGYAGGITSAAVDGIKVAESVLRLYTD